MHRGACVVSSYALEEHIVPLTRHAVVGTYNGIVNRFRAIGTGVCRAHVARIGNSVQVVVRRCRYEVAVVGHNDIVPLAFTAEDVDEAVIVYIQKRHVVTIGDPVEDGVAVRIVESSVDVFIYGDASAAVARRYINIHVGNHHIIISI